MQAVTYARVSTQRHAEHGYSLNDQKALLAEHCRGRGYTHVEHIADEGISGRIEERPGLQRVLHLAEAGRVGCVIAVNLKRFGRENRLIQQALHAVRERGVRVEFTEHSSGDTPAERLLENVLGGVAEFEWEEIRRRTMAGRLQKAREKKVMANGVAPFGFQCISTAEAVVKPEYHGRSGEYLLVPEQAEIVRGMFERCAQGQSLRSIADWVREQHGSGEKGLSRSYIQTMLRNPAYAGRPEYRRQYTRTVGGKVKRSVRPPEERIQLQCPAIVSEELFAAVQARLDANRENLRGRPTRIWLLKGCVECGVCIVKGQPRRCTGAGGHERNGTKRYYRCNSRIDGKEVWCGSQFLADDLEELARISLIEAAKPDRLAELERQRAEAAAKDRGNPERLISECRKALAALDNEEDKTLEAALAGFSAATIEKRVASIIERRAKLEASMAAARGEAAMIADPREAAARGEAAAVRLREALKDPEQFTDLARLFLTIRLFPDRRPEITVRVPPAFGRS